MLTRACKTSTNLLQATRCKVESFFKKKKEKKVTNRSQKFNNFCKINMNNLFTSFCGVKTTPKREKIQGEQNISYVMCS